MHTYHTTRFLQQNTILKSTAHIALICVTTSLIFDILILIFSNGHGIIEFMS